MAALLMFIHEVEGDEEVEDDDV
ncbi:hypothetical protein A2U01_0097292, partial [Trifolium medium]|nr:hypothetical protein [Trifolium medium]